MKLILRWIISAATLLLIAQYIEGITVNGFYAALITALVLGLVNAIIRPVVVFFTLPINIITLGLFTFIINGVLFWFVATIVENFEVSGFWPAFWGALILTLVSWFANLFLKEKN